MPGIGGRLERTPEDFVVDEIPAYAPTGDGTHWLVRVRKRDLTTPAARELLAKAAGVDPRELGFAGRKDRCAISTQWFSMPCAPVQPADERLTVLESAPHPHKLRLGHLKGNRFQIRLRELDVDAASRLPALLERLRHGVPSYFGEQRFGRDADNPARAVAMLRSGRRPPRDADFLVSALQSAIFNAWLGARVRDGLLHTAVDGDVLRKRESGGLFVCGDPVTDGRRVLAGEVDPTGPLPGKKNREAEREAAAREAAAIEAIGLSSEELAALARLAPGARRAARIVPEDFSASSDGDTLLVTLTLPPGVFATVVLAELMHPAAGVRVALSEDG